MDWVKALHLAGRFNSRIATPSALVSTLTSSDMVEYSSAIRPPEFADGKFVSGRREGGFFDYTAKWTARDPTLGEQGSCPQTTTRAATWIRSGLVLIPPFLCSHTCFWPILLVTTEPTAAEWPLVRIRIFDVMSHSSSHHSFGGCSTTMTRIWRRPKHLVACVLPPRWTLSYSLQALVSLWTRCGLFVRPGLVPLSVPHLCRSAFQAFSAEPPAP